VLVLEFGGQAQTTRECGVGREVEFVVVKVAVFALGIVVLEVEIAVPGQERGFGAVADVFVFAMGDAFFVLRGGRFAGVARRFVARTVSRDWPLMVNNRGDPARTPSLMDATAASGQARISLPVLQP